MYFSKPELDRIDMFKPPTACSLRVPYEKKKESDFHLTPRFSGASGWAWIQEDEIVRNI
jgi:hypothetical protein